jgi:hypothetical protein
MERTIDIPKTTTSGHPVHAVHIVPPGERVAAGKALRDKLPREQLGRWNDIKGRPDPIDILHKSDAGRMRKLLPIRYGRMLQSPFTFYRGAAAVMVADLARTDLHSPMQIKPSVIMPRLRPRFEKAKLLPVRSPRLGFLKLCRREISAEP